MTGDKRGAGTDSNVFLILVNSDGQRSKIQRLSHSFQDDHERGASAVFHKSSSDIGIKPPFSAIEMYIDECCTISLGNRLNGIFFGGPRNVSTNWFVDLISVKYLDEPPWIFPIHRWVHQGVIYQFYLYDCVLPQNDPRKFFRSEELKKKKETYVLSQKIHNGPVQVMEETVTHNNIKIKLNTRRMLACSKMGCCY